MTRLIEVLISLAIVVALFLAISLVLPSSRHLSQDVETNRKLTIVFDTLDSLHRFKDWNPLVLHDPKLQMKYSGPDSGVGAQMDYTSKLPEVGDGSWKITAVDPGKSVTYAITNNQRGSDKTSKFTFAPTGHGGRNIKITQTYNVTYGLDLLGRYAGLYVSRHVGDDVKLGLERLTSMLATVPNVDYRMQDSKLVGLKMMDRPAENLLVVSAGSVPRDNDKLKVSMKANMEWIKRTVDASGLVADGPIRIISTEFGGESYTFDIAQAVHRAGAPADAPLSGLKLQGPVKYVQTKAGRVANVSFTGFALGLDNVHNALRAWALTQGLEVVDRPYDTYNNGIDQAFTENGQFDVYWPLK